MRTLLILSLVLLCSCLAVACDDNDPVAPAVLVVETYVRSGGDGLLTLAYRSAAAGTVLMRQPKLVADGTFTLTGDDIEIRLPGTRLTGDFDYDFRKLKLNDGTRWEWVRR